MGREDGALKGKYLVPGEIVHRECDPRTAIPPGVKHLERSLGVEPALSGRYEHTLRCPVQPYVHLHAGPRACRTHLGGNARPDGVAQPRGIPSLSAVLLS